MAHGVSTIYPLGEHQSTAMGAATRHGLGLSASIGRGLPGSDAATAAAGGKNAAVGLSGHLGRGEHIAALGQINWQSIGCIAIWNWV